MTAPTTATEPETQEVQDAREAHQAALVALADHQREWARRKTLQAKTNERLIAMTSERRELFRATSEAFIGGTDPQPQEIAKIAKLDVELKIVGDLQHELVQTLPGFLDRQTELEIDVLNTEARVYSARHTSERDRWLASLATTKGSFGEFSAEEPKPISDLLRDGFNLTVRAHELQKALDERIARRVQRR